MPGCADANGRAPTSLLSRPRRRDYTVHVMDVPPLISVTRPPRWPTPDAPPWRTALFERLRGQPLSFVRTGDDCVSAASLWAGARRWTSWLRARGVASGDRVVCALPPGPGFVMLLVAALWDELTFVPAPASANVDALLDAVDARVAVVEHGGRTRSGVVAAERAGTPPDAMGTLRTARSAPTPRARFLLQTSGTTGGPRRLALSDANVQAVLASHAAALALEGAVVLSVLPWHHAFGLVLELMPALLGGAELVRDPSGGRDAGAMVAVAAAHPVTHLHAVPHTVRLLAEHGEGRALLRALRGGLVGGAAVDGALAALLATTRLRVGYGQTEASPGIALGEPGAWRAGTLGRPVGCEVRLDDDGVLAFRGPNAYLGAWRDHTHGGELDVLSPDRWVRTGDLARLEVDGTYTFEGRLADSFKLANGRFVAALDVERRVCARWPQLAEAMLSSPDGHGLVLAASTARDSDPLPEAATVAAMLGPLGTRPLDVMRVAPDAWVRTPKGDLDRRFPTGRVPQGSTPVAPTSANRAAHASG